MLKTYVSRTSQTLYKCINVVVVSLLAVMVASIGIQVLTRFVMNRALSWSEEVALLCFGWIVLLMLPCGVYRSFHVRMDLIMNLLPSRMRQMMENLVIILILGFGLYLGISGIEYVRMTAISVSPAVGYPIYLLYVAAPLSGFLTAWFAVDRMLCGAAPEENHLVDGAGEKP